MQAPVATALPPLEETDVLEDDRVDTLDTYDAFAGHRPARPARTPAPARARTRRGGPRAPLPLLPIIAVCAAVGIGYVAQTAHLTQTSYEETSVSVRGADLQRQADELGDELARLRAPDRIDAAAARLGLKPPSKWAYVPAVAPPVAPAPADGAPASSSAPTAAPGHVVQARVGTVGPDGQGAGGAGRTP